MTYLAKPKFRHPALEKNDLGFTRRDYEGAISTLTLEEKAGKTLLTIRETYPSKAALDENIEGMGNGYPEQFDQLDALLAGSA